MLGRLEEFRTWLKMAGLSILDYEIAQLGVEIRSNDQPRAKFRSLSCKKVNNANGD